MSFAKMKFLIAAILLAACAAVQGRSVQVHPMISMLEYRKGLDSRIIDGDNAPKGMFPWQAALITKGPEGTYLCGGSLISKNWILTAAHCVLGITNVEVHLGGVNLWTDMEYNHISTKFMHHENYNPSTLENDVGLIELPVPATLSFNVQIVRLPPRSLPDLAGSTLLVSGYGQTLTGSNSEILQFVDLTAITNAECASYFPSNIFPSNLCARGAPHHSTCQGDSGGPLVHYIPDGTQVGVVSFVSGAGCNLGRPSGYARVTSFLDWISQHTGIPIRD